jgi:hypothetical protein
VYLCHILGNRTSYCNPVFKALQVQRRRIGVGERDKCLRRLLRVVGLFSIDSDRCFTRSPRRCSICVDYFFRVFDGIAAVLLSAEVPWFHYRHMNSQWSDLDGQALGDAFYGKFRRAIAIWLQRNALTASWLERIEVVAEAPEIARAVVEHELNDERDARPEQLSGLYLKRPRYVCREGRAV